MESTIKILRIITRLTISGPTLHTLLLTQKINTSDHQTLLVTGVPEKDEKGYEGAYSNYGVKPLVVKELSRTPGLFKEAIALVKLCKVIKRYQPDIVHTHHAKAGTIGRLAAKMMGVRTRIHTYHGHVLSGYFPKLISNMVVLVERFFAKLSSSIVTISQEQYSDIVEIFKISSPQKTSVIPLGFEFEKMVNHRQAEGYWRHKLGDSPDTICIGFVGRLAPIKNTALMLNVFNEFAKINQDTSLWVIGDGPDREMLDITIDKLHLEGKVKFLGWQSEISDIYRDLDLLLLTSINEGTPVAIIESLSHGTPVVSTNVGGVKSIVSLPEMGAIVDTFEPAEIAQIVHDVLEREGNNKSDREKWYSLMHLKYGSERLVRDIQNLYHSLLN